MHKHTRRLQQRPGNYYATHSLLRMNSLIALSDSYGLLASITTSACLAAYLERNNKYFKALSAPVTAMLVTVVATNVGILPSTGSPFVADVQKFVVKLATPLLLLSADVQRIFRETGPMLKAFILGSFGTLLGSLIGCTLLSQQLQTIGVPGDWRIVAALLGKNIGGGLNYMVVADVLGISDKTKALGLAVDNFLGLVYFPLISWLAAPYEIVAQLTDINDKETEDSVHVVVTKPTMLEGPSTSVNIKDNCGTVSADNMLSAFTVACVITALSESLGNLLSLPPLPTSTLLSILAATAFPKALSKLVPAGEALGKVLLMLFFGSIGNSMGLISTAMSAKGVLSLFSFGLILYVVHLSIIIGIGKNILKLDMSDILLASNANIGNHATASSLAVSKGWGKSLLPAVLVGTLGNAIGSFCGIYFGSFLVPQ